MPGKHFTDIDHRGWNDGSFTVDFLTSYAHLARLLATLTTFAIFLGPRIR
jgi:hypothetical protein